MYNFQKIDINRFICDTVYLYNVVVLLTVGKPADGGTVVVGKRSYLIMQNIIIFFFFKISMKYIKRYFYNIIN